LRCVSDISALERSIGIWIFNEVSYPRASHEEYMIPDSEMTLSVSLWHVTAVQRMKGAIDFFLKGDNTALARFPGGSEPGS